MRWIAFTLAPAATASDAAVCLRSCGVMAVRPAATHAGSNTRGRQLLILRTPPWGAVKTRSSGPLPSHTLLRDSARLGRSGTDLVWWFLGVDHTRRPPISVTLSATTRRR